MQLTITIPQHFEPILKAMAIKSGKQESDVATSLLLDCLSSNLSLGQGWQQMYEAVQEFEPDFVLQRECLPEQVRQELM